MILQWEATTPKFIFQRLQASSKVWMHTCSYVMKGI